MPVWNVPELAPEKGSERISWGAFVVYLGCVSEEVAPYHQVHLQHPLVKNYFVSFSPLEDPSRAPQGWRTVTISTHTHTSEWFGLEREEYKKKKKELQDFILAHFQAHFSITETKFISSGTPKTFEKYTLRKDGQVGGLPFLHGMNPWKILGHRTASENVYRVGDTTFPGQGIVGVVAGALGLHQELSKKEDSPR
jgi:phytoene dehydrogenase-like protein